LLELPAQLQSVAARDQQVDHGHARGQLLELLGGVGGVQCRGDLVALGAQEVLRQVGGVGVALGEQDQQPGLARLGLVERQPPSSQALGEQAMGVGGCQALGELDLDEAELIDLVARVQAMAPGAALWDREPVAFLPGPQRRWRNAQHLPDRADAVDRSAAHRWTLANPLPPPKPPSPSAIQDLFRM
jgi:hypothetical protein